MSAAAQKIRRLAEVVRGDPGNLSLRTALAEALIEGGRIGEAVGIYYSIAHRHVDEGRFARAIAVCHAIQALDAGHAPTRLLLESLALRRPGARPAGRGEGEQAAPLPPPPGPVDPVIFDLPPEIPSPSAPPTVEDEEALRTVRRSRREFDGVLSPTAGTAAPALTDADPSPPSAFPLLDELPHAAFLELVSRLNVRREPAGARILEEGTTGEACYLIAAGRVRVLKGGVEVAQLGPGALFGEFAVLADQHRHASVEALEAVELLEISRQLLDELVSAHPGVARTLRRFYSERLLATLTATAPFFAPLSARERGEVAARFRSQRYGKGARIVEQGAPGGGLYLILVGEVEVLFEEGAREVRLGLLGEGSYFGEMSLLRNGVAAATVRALRTTEVVQLPARDFYDVLAAHPVLWEDLRAEAARREMMNFAILSGEARQSSDGKVYLL